MSERDCVLVSWLARTNDPYEHARSGEYVRNAQNERIQGPTLSFLFDLDSPYHGRVDVLTLLTQTDDVSIERAAKTFREVRSRDPEIRCERLLWKGKDPTDHQAIFRFVRHTLPALRRRHPGKRLLVHTSPGTASMATIWVLMGATGFIQEPFELLKSLRAHERDGRPAVMPIEIGIDTFYKRYQQSRPSETSSGEQQLQWDPSDFRSDSLKRLYDQAGRIARLNAPVLLLGERGVGKTTLAGWVRFRSPFRKEQQDQCWPAVACGQYRPDTMRAELFGYRRGAFTGADEDRQGLLARADGETLFLDEIGDLAHDTQRLLIKAIEERRFLPLGSTDWKDSRFRLITATNLTLAELRQRLDPDFFDRVALLRLRVPSLREIPEDIPWLWHETWRRVLDRSGVDMALGDEQHTRIVKFLKGQSLPGNLRDLHAVAWRILAQWHEPPAGEEALARWLPSALDQAKGVSSGELARDVAARFAAGDALDDLVGEGAPLATKEVQKALLAWMAGEVRRIARQRGLAQDSLVDVTAKTMREWVREG